MKLKTYFISAFKYVTLSKLSVRKRIWFLFIFLTGLILTVFVPPLQKPDEYIHFQRAVALSNGLVSCAIQKNEWSIQKKYQNLFVTIDKYKVTQRYEGKFDYKEYLIPIFASKDENTLITANATDLCSLSAISYVPQSLALMISNLLNFNEIVGFYLGRMFALLTFLIVLIFILNKSPKNYHVIFLTTASIPMFLHQAGSYSYDSIQYTAFFLLMYFLFRLISSDCVSLKQAILYSFALIILHFSKQNGSWLLFLTPVFFIDTLAKTIGNKILIISISIYILITSGLFIRSQQLTIMPSAGDAKMTEVSASQLQVEVIKNNPWQIIDVLHATTLNDFNFYIKSFIGILGWLDYELGAIVYIVYICFITVALYRFKFTKIVQYVELKIVVSLLIIVLTYVLTVLGMYIYYTSAYMSIGGNLSQGTQGRYFLLLVPSVFLLSGLLKQSRIALNTSMIFVATFIFYKILNSIFLRYYDYNSIYDIPRAEELIDKSTYKERKVIDLEGSKIGVLIDKNKKLKGLSIFNIVTQNARLIPYIYIVTDGSCDGSQDAVRKGVISERDVNNQQINIIFKKSIDQNEIQSNSVCLILEPLINDFSETKSVVFLRYFPDLNALPIYNR